MLVEHCFICHSAETNSKGGLRVDDLNGLLRGGNTGPALVPGQPEQRTYRALYVGPGDEEVGEPGNELTITARP